jgi:large subunit ribosomal protein L13e
MMATGPKVLKKGGKQRLGKGFSRKELNQAGSNPKEALRLHIPIDVKRRTVHEENVETLKKLLETKKAAVKPKKKSKS